MSTRRDKCAVGGCTVEHSVLHKLPASEDFIYEANVPDKVSKRVFVCSHHFASDCGQRSPYLVSDRISPTYKHTHF